MARAYPVFLVLGLVGAAAGCARTPAAVDPPAVEPVEPVLALPRALPMSPAPPAPPPPATPPGATPPAGQTPASSGPPQTTKAPAFLDTAAKQDGKTLAEWITRLGDADDLARAEAAEVIARYGPNAKAAVPPLAKLLSNPKDVAWFPAVAAVRPVGPAAREAVDALIGLLQNPDADVCLTLLPAGGRGEDPGRSSRPGVGGRGC